MKYIRRTTKDINKDFLVELLEDRGFKLNNSFFNPTEENELLPINLDNIQLGTEVLKKHIINNSKIHIIADCDVDGYTSAALIYNYLNQCPFFKNYNFELSYHIPLGKEHGLKTIIKEYNTEKKFNLIILPDSSSNDYEEHKELKELGYDILVLDHHIADYYSENAVVINNQLSKNYENKSLSGVGVVYKFIEFFNEMWKVDNEIYDNEFDIKQYIDLVALGQISDMMNMNTIENRYYCDYGLTHLNNEFFKELVEKQSYSIGSTLTQIGVAFYITPLINALIRVGSDLEKERLFEAFVHPNMSVPSTKRGEKGLTETICTQSARNCVNAKARQKRELEKAVDLLKLQVENDCLNDNKILIILADDLDIPTTLTGLCAMNVSTAYKKPVILGRTCSDGTLKGSIRGRGETELKDFRQLLLDSTQVDWVQGHANAAGISLKINNIPKLIEYTNEKLKDVDFNEGLYEVDFIVNANCDYLDNLILDLDGGKYLWGQGCEEPMLAVENITLKKSDMAIIGSNKDTLRFTFNGITYIKFKAKELIDKINNYTDKINITIVGRGNINVWGGRQTPQILIDEIEISNCDINSF